MKHPFLRLPALLLGIGLAACSGDLKPARTWTLISGGVTAADVTTDHALLADHVHGAEWWQLQPQKKRYDLRHDGRSKQSLIAVSITADGRHGLTADRGRIAWWDLKTGHALASWALPSIQHAVISADGRWALIGLSDRAVYFSLAHGKTRHAFPHDRKVTAVALDEQSRFALTGGEDGSAKLWDLRSGKLLHTWHHHGKVAAVALSPRGTYAMTNVFLGPIRIWRTASGELMHKLGPRFITVTCAAFSPGEGFLATGHPARGIRLWSVKQGQLLRRFEPAQASILQPSARPILAVRFARQGRHLLGATSDGNVHEWRVKK